MEIDWKEILFNIRIYTCNIEFPWYLFIRFQLGDIEEKKWEFLRAISFIWPARIQYLISTKAFGLPLSWKTFKRILNCEMHAQSNHIAFYWINSNATITTIFKSEYHRYYIKECCAQSKRMPNNDVKIGGIEMNTLCLFTYLHRHHFLKVCVYVCEEDELLCVARFLNTKLHKKKVFCLLYICCYCKTYKIIRNSPFEMKNEQQ